MNQQLKELPIFKSEDEERDFWTTHDSGDYFDLSKMKLTVFPNLKPSTKAISIRLPEAMINSIKVEANKRDVPYQSLIKVWLSEHVKKAA